MKKILVGIDGSRVQARVLAEAVELARRLDAELVLFHAVSLPTELPREALSASPDSVGDILITRARKDIDALLRSIQPPLRARARVELGTSWKQILEAAKAEQASLIVIGSHGYGGLDRLLGTTAAKVVNHADRSVLVIRPEGPLPL
jgi:nucleotide-binding universal stress UspA family protein